MINDLALTDEQAEKIAAIDTKYRRLYYENRGSYDRIDRLRQDHRKEIDNILNESQRKRFSSVYDRRWSSWGRNYGRRHMGDYYGHGYGMGFCSGVYSSSDYMQRNLDLTAEQVKQINDVDLKYRDQYYKTVMILIR